MGIGARVMQDMHEAMRSGDTIRRDTLRMMRAALRNEEIARRASLDDEAAAGVLRREMKKRQEALEMFRQGGREDLVANAEAEIAIIKEYLPAQLSAEEVERLAAETIEEVGATEVRQMGQVMKVLMPRLQGRADGRLVSETVRRLLSS